MARIALITGGMGGLGEAVCMKMAALGYQVVTTYSPGNTKSAEWLSSMEQQGYKFYAYPCDVSDYDSAQQCVAQITKDHGPVDVLVNNAGITRDNLLVRMKDDDWDAIMATNLKPAFHLAKLVLRGMMKARRGRIIQIGSVVGSSGNAGQTNYAAAKAALVGFTKSLALEVGSRDITVNCVAPGFVDTEMTQALAQAQREALIARIPLGRLGTPDDVANAVLFLAGPRAGYITGATLHVNGGMLMP